MPYSLATADFYLAFAILVTLVKYEREKNTLKKNVGHFL